MGDWSEMELADEELGDAARRLLSVPGFGFGYLATVRDDGAPRVHPVMPFVVGGRLEVFVVPSPKLDDLRRDGRFSLHSTASEQVNDELYVSGRARIIDDPAGERSPERRRAAIAASRGRVADDHVLVELELEHVLWGHYADPPSWPPTRRHWTPVASSGTDR